MHTNVSLAKSAYTFTFTLTDIFSRFSLSKRLRNPDIELVVSSTDTLH